MFKTGDIVLSQKIREDGDGGGYLGMYLFIVMILAKKSNGRWRVGGESKP